MQQSTPYLSFRGIGKTFPGVKALTDISFDCYAGQIHALMGENGAGKSTLLKNPQRQLCANHGFCSD